MKKTISVMALASFFAAGSAYASGYRIPEQSVDSVAKAGAHVASSTHADSSYYNPANMSWASNDWLAEIDLSWIHLSSIDYTDSRSASLNGSSEEENFLLPTMFLVSPDLSGLRFGFSVTAPYGLAKRWEQPYPATYARKFSLEVYEINPSASYEIGRYASIGGGVRLLTSRANARNGGATASGIGFNRDLDGDWGTDWGYNLALAVKPTDDLNLSITYRSNVDLDLSGDAVLSTDYPSRFVMETTGDVSLPAPAVLAIAGSYTWRELTVELTYDRTFWSEYEALDIGYSEPLTHPVLSQIFGSPVPKDWKDTNAFRISASYRFGMFTAMAGFAIDENPIPEENVGFELPDSDAYLYSIGGRFTLSENMELGLGILYDYKESRRVNNSVAAGEFENASALLISTGLSYKF